MPQSLEYVLPAASFWTIALFVFAFGCCVGSFLNVVIYRLPLDMKVSQPRRSFCPKCKYQIPMWLNIPILSWVLLRGKCANCKAPISSRYLWVEFLTGVLFLVTYLHFGQDQRYTGWDHSIAAAWIFLALAVAGSFIDIEHQILPHSITWGGAAAGLICAAVVPQLIVEDTWWMNVLHSLGGAALGYAVVWGIVHLGKLAFGRIRMDFTGPVPWSVTQAEGAEDVVLKVEGPDKVHEETWANIFSRPTDKLIVRAPWALLGSRRVEDAVLTMTNDSVTVTPQAGGAAETIPLEQIPSMSGVCTHVEQPREAMGMGDANWMACVGAFFGWKAVLFTILAGSCIGAVISLLMILLRRREWAARIPFGPYLAAGAVIWMFYGPVLLKWYFNLARGPEAAP
jgi:leader peptidase (prepilin peptidase)/N-methyltransferase